MFERDSIIKKEDERHLKLLESVITHTSDVVIITEAELQQEPGPRILYVNDAFTQMTGYSSEEVLGRSPRFLQGPKTDKTELKRLSKALAAWQSCEITIVNYKKNGEEFWINLSVTPVANEEGLYTHWISIERDVTEQRKLAEEFKQIFDFAPDAICTVGVDGYFKKINPAMCTLLEYTQEELLARPVVKIIHPDEQVKIMTELEVLNKGESTYYFENRCITKSGKIKWLAWTSTPASEEGVIFTVAKDITEKKELEDLLHKATKLSGIGSWDLDLIHETVYWSDLTKEIHEVEFDYVPNIKTIIDFYRDAENKGLVIRKIELAIKDCTSFDLEAQIVTARGNIKWIRVIGEPEFFDNKCVRMRGSFQDIDIRKKAEILARDVLEEKNIILESIGDAFFALDRNWIVTYWNNMAEKVLGKSKKEMLDNYLWDVFSDSIGSASYKKYNQAVDTNMAVHFDDYYPPLDKWYEVSAYPSENGLSVYFKDVTDRFNYIKAIETQNETLKEVSWMQSHVIRAPLSRIMGLVELAKILEDDDEEKTKVLDYILSSAHELDEVIKKITDKSKTTKSSEL